MTLSSFADYKVFKISIMLYEYTPNNLEIFVIVDNCFIGFIYSIDDLFHFPIIEVI